MDINIIKNELHRLKEIPDFMTAWNDITNSCRNIYLIARDQEDLINEYSSLFSIRGDQRYSNLDNLINGDLYIANNDCFIDLKVSTKNTDDTLCGVINVSSLKGFRTDGWYLCINKSFSKFAFFSHQDIYNKYINKELRVYSGISDFIPANQYNLFTKIIEI